MELETVTEKQGAGRPSLADVPFTVPWLMREYGITRRRAVRHRAELLRIPMMKPEARAFSLKQLHATVVEVK